MRGKGRGRGKKKDVRPIAGEGLVNLGMFRGKLGMSGKE